MGGEDPVMKNGASPLRVTHSVVREANINDCKCNEWVRENKRSPTVSIKRDGVTGNLSRRILIGK